MTEHLMPPEEVTRGKELLTTLRNGLGTVLMGQEELLDLVTIALAARGHVLLEGLPGLGKTELVKGLGALLGLSFKRIQFTPDLLPSDITGSPVLEEQNGVRKFVFQEGPLFANLVLSDEINRASPKTQSALLEAMQESRVTVMGTTHQLPIPFFVLATQNPIELEGTYPLPEAQLDRFLFKVNVPVIGAEVLTSIITERRRGQPPELTQVLDADGIRELFDLVDKVFLPKPVAQYIGRLTEASHGTGPSASKEIRSHVKYGASPRAAISMGEAGRVCALLAGRPNVDFKDVAKVAVPTLAHRLVLKHTARLEGITQTDIVRKLLEETEEIGDALPGELS